MDLIETDLLDIHALDQCFSAARPQAVVHLAGLKSVGESVDQPLRYYTHNLGSTMNLLHTMERHRVRSLVFSSSATVYGDLLPPPFAEGDGPLRATNPYGQTKLVIERLLEDVAQADPQWSIAILRYFNPMGAHESGLIGEDAKGIPSNLSPYISQVALGKRSELTVFGDDYSTADGTGERDYIHVMDLAEGHVAALEHLPSLTGARAWNLGTGKATSVLELVTQYSHVTGRDIPYRVAPRRKGDVAQAWADVSRARDELGWSTRRGVEQMARDAWNWQQKNPNGYSSEV